MSCMTNLKQMAPLNSVNQMMTASGSLIVTTAKTEMDASANYPKWDSVMATTCLKMCSVNVANHALDVIKCINQFLHVMGHCIQTEVVQTLQEKMSCAT